MYKVKELFDRVNSFDSPLHIRYPELKYNDRKKIVFVSPILNKHGLFRMILPSLELRETGNFHTIVTNIIPEACNKTIDDFNIKMNSDVIKWADIIFFQASSQDMRPLFKSIKTLNPKIRIGIDVDRNYHNLNQNNYTFKKFNIDRANTNSAKINPQMIMVDNLIAADFSTYPDKLNELFYQKKSGLSLKTYILPNLISPFMFEDINILGTMPPKANKKRIVLLADQDDYDDISSFRVAISELCVAIPDMDLFVLGNCVSFEGKNPLKFVNCNFITYKSMMEYYKILHNINPDVAIIPLKRLKYQRSYYKLLELGALGIPMVAINDYPYNHLLKEKTHILLATKKNTFLKAIKNVITKPELSNELIRNAQSFVLTKYNFTNPEMQNFWINAFLD